MGLPTTPCRRDGLIAINYAARARGVTRHMRVREALAKCPEIKLVHVATVGASEAAGEPSAAPDRWTEKASLERYR